MPFLIAATALFFNPHTAVLPDGYTHNWDTAFLPLTGQHCAYTTISPPERLDVGSNLDQTAWIMSSVDQNHYIQVGWWNGRFYFEISDGGHADKIAVDPGGSFNTPYLDDTQWFGETVYDPAIYGLCDLGEGVWQIRIGDRNIAAAFVSFDGDIWSVSTEGLNVEPPHADFGPVTVWA